MPASAVPASTGTGVAHRSAIAALSASLAQSCASDAAVTIPVTVSVVTDPSGGGGGIGGSVIEVPTPRQPVPRTHEKHNPANHRRLLIKDLAGVP
jgi:hypothetical protein